MENNPLGKVNPLVMVAGVVVGGYLSLSVGTSLVMEGVRTVTEARRKKTAPPCSACNGRGFMQCKLCKGNASIEWSPLYDPIVMKPCVCPTCEGNRVQRCLNCIGKGFV